MTDASYPFVPVGHRSMFGNRLPRIGLALLFIRFVITPGRHS